MYIININFGNDLYIYTDGYVFAVKLNKLDHI